MLHDIRDQIPRTDQTNPAKFPQYEFRPYPKMMNDENGKPYVKADKSCVVVNDAAEEAMFHADPKRFGAIIKTVAPAVSALIGETEEVKQLKAELAALKASTSGAELAALKAFASEPVKERKKPGRKPKVQMDEEAA
jgi:hypothetical protein